MMNIQKEDIIKVTGILGTVMTIGATLLNSYSSKKEQEAIIDKKVTEAIAKKLMEYNDSQI